MDRKMTALNLTATIWEEDGAYVSRCPELEVASFGNTPEETLQNLKEAVELYLEDAEERSLVPYPRSR